MSQVHQIAPLEDFYKLKNEVIRKDKYIAELERKLNLYQSKLSYYENKYSDILPNDDEDPPNDDWSTLQSVLNGQSTFSYLLTPAPAPPVHNHNPYDSDDMPTSPTLKSSHSRRKKSLPDTLPSSNTPKSKIKRKKPRASLPAYPTKNVVGHVTIVQSFIRGKRERDAIKAMVEKQIQNRRFSIIEILQAEQNYNRILLTIMKYYKIPATQSDLFSFSEIKYMFMNLDQIFESSQRFLKILEVLFKEDPLVVGHRLGLLFLKMIPEWREYSYFCNNYDKAMETIQKCKERKAVKEWFKTVDYTTHVGKLCLGDLLIAPVKRIPQYEILLKAVKKNTPKSSRHYPAIRSAKSMITELAQNINKKKKEIENLEKLKRIQSSLIGSVPDIVTPDREFLDEITAFEETIDLNLIEKKFILFNDCIVISSIAHRFDRLIFLHDASIIDLADKKFMLKVDPYKVTLVFHSSSHKTLWMNNIKNSIETIRYQQDHSMIRDFIVDTISPRVVKNYVLLEGYLYKQKKQLKTWNKRWFVLEQGFLYFFKSKKTSNKEKGFLDLSMYFLREDKVNTHESKHRFAFELYSHRFKGIILAAESNEKRKDWMEKIRPFILFGRNSSNMLEVHKKDEQKNKDLMVLEEKKDPLGLKDSRFYFDEDTMDRYNPEDEKVCQKVNDEIVIEDEKKVSNKNLQKIKQSGKTRSLQNSQNTHYLAPQPQTNSLSPRSIGRSRSWSKPT